MDVLSNTISFRFTQVKVRGFRNEPGEIEAVRAAVVLDGNALTGYPGERPPAYMVPARHMVLRQLTRGVEGADGGI